MAEDFKVHDGKQKEEKKEKVLDDTDLLCFEDYKKIYEQKYLCVKNIQKWLCTIGFHPSFRQKQEYHSNQHILF